MEKKEYDIIIVGAGLYGAVTANLAYEHGLKCLVLDRRNHIGGNIYSENRDGIEIHRYGAHIFHTSDEDVWKYANKFTQFNNYRHSPLASYKGKLYHLPFNMNTFYEAFGTQKPMQAKHIIDEEKKKERIGIPINLEQKAISMVGRTLYEKLVKGYTEKQWGRSCTDLPAYVIGRLPIRFTYNNDYFDDKYQGIPMNGYTAWTNNMLRGTEVRLGVDFNKDKEFWTKKANIVIYCGSIDEYFGYSLGVLQYRSLKFETNLIDMENYQGCAVINETASSIPYTRTIEHKHFTGIKSPVTYITREFPEEWKCHTEAYYPVNNERNMSLYHKYRELATAIVPNVVFGGRLGLYRYNDMDDTIRQAVDNFKSIIK